MAENLIMKKEIGYKIVNLENCQVLLRKVVHEEGNPAISYSCYIYGEDYCEWVAYPNDDVRDQAFNDFSVKEARVFANEVIEMI